MQVTVVDSNSEFTSTKVAAGIMLPVTGRRLAKTYKADHILPFARKTYKSIEKTTGTNFYADKQVLQIFSSVANLNEWYARSAETEMQEYCGEILSNEQIDKSVLNNFGGILLNQSGYVESITFLHSVRNFIAAKGSYLETDFNARDVEIDKNSITWKNNNYTHLFFCEGHQCMQNPFFSYLPFKPAKGEIIDFISDELPETYIVTSGIYILPLGNKKFRAGATYEWDDLTEQPTAKGFEFLKNSLEQTITCNFEIIGHKAGIRPAMRDRRPVAGMHPVYKNVGILNGLGTKGAMLAPYYASQVVELLKNNKILDRDINVSRFDALYSAT